jgi:hypothetical protein
MRKRVSASMITVAIVAAAAGAIVSLSVTRTEGQATRPARVGGKPNFSGIWQANNEANWDLEAHAARPGMVTQQGVYPYEYARVPAAPVLALGSVGGVPGSLGVVQGDGQIPYKPEALAEKRANAANWIDRDPEIKCYLPGLPRAMYMPYPFEITQSTNKIHFAYEFTSTARTVHLDKVDGPPDDTWMGHSVGRWDGDTLVVDVTNFNDRTWLDRAGNFHSDAMKLTERFSPISPEVLRYEVTIEDLHAAVAHCDADLPPDGAQHAADRVSLHRVRGRVHVRQPAEAAAGEALGRGNHGDRHHAQGPPGRQVLSVVRQVSA